MPTFMCVSVQQTPYMSEEEDIEMKETNNSVAPTLVVKPKIMFLTALHVLVLTLAVLWHPPVEIGAVRVLP